jgi:hypothetical protein
MESVTQTAGASIWIKNDYDFDDENDYYENNENLNDVSPEFVNNILAIKHQLYEDIILGPDINSKDAQDTSLVNKYLDKVNLLYGLTSQAKTMDNTYRVKPSDVMMFPSNSVQMVTDILNFIIVYFNDNNNSEADKIPYSYYIDYHLHEYPFLQDKSFIYE